VLTTSGDTIQPYFDPRKSAASIGDDHGHWGGCAPSGSPRTARSVGLHASRGAAATLTGSQTPRVRVGYAGFQAGGRVSASGRRRVRRPHG
jgi:hypothetical protein